MSKIVGSNYEIIEKIGFGGGGNVYLANHLRLHKKVVLKADKRKITTREELLRREVDVLKKLRHTYIPQVHDYFIEDDTVYTVIDYIDGESLDKPLKRGERFPQPQVVKWAIQLLEALCYLHNPEHEDPPKGFVHSDIKPANIMCRPNQDICLIDFNIALALGEKNAVGHSAGYASPEHYGQDFSGEYLSETAVRTRRFFGKEKDTVLDTDVTSLDIAPARVIIPDVRSDIYSLGATLYHLLSGNRPAKYAKEVVPLSEKEFSPQIVQIISKAMNPNPNLRYQTAEEMLYAFLHLRENDLRTRRLKRNRRWAAGIFLFLFLFGAAASFSGLKGMQLEEKSLKLAEYSQNALATGDSETAVRYALQALPGHIGPLESGYIAEAQKALTDALGVYDLADGYKAYKTVELSSAPLNMVISPDGSLACCICAYSASVIDTASAKELATLPMVESALSEAVFLNDHVLIYAGQEGITAYDAEKGSALWRGEPATSICISGDRKKVAAVYREEQKAFVYDSESGEVMGEIDFDGRHQQITENDRFLDPHDNLLALNQDGTLLGVSFSDGSLMIYEVEEQRELLTVFDKNSGYTHFEGGFYEKYFAFSASDSSKSVFAVIDTENSTQTGGFESETSFGVQTDENGIYLQQDNFLVRIHPVSGEQTALVTTSETIRHFSRSNDHTLLATKSGFLFFDKNGGLITHCETGYASDFVQIAEGVALIGSSDSPTVRIMKYENHPGTEVFTYDPSCEHDEARISASGETVMLFSYDRFRLYGLDGTLLAEKEFPDKDQIYDQQYIRDKNDSWLEVSWHDGTVRRYSADDGRLLDETIQEKPDLTLYEEFDTEEFRIESPLHGTPVVYSKATDKLVAELKSDDYLIYITQAGEYLIVQYMTADGYCYGQLLNEKCEVLADLPYLCDVVGETLFFDYPTGNMRESCIYNTGELLKIARKYLREEKENET